MTKSVSVFHKVFLLDYLKHTAKTITKRFLWGYNVNIRYSSTVASLAVLWPKEIMCCSWRWVVAAPNPKDFGLFLAQEVLMMQPKMEMSSHLREPEVSREQHPLCLPGEARCSLMRTVTWPTSFMKRQLWQKMERKKPSWEGFRKTYHLREL